MANNVLRDIKRQAPRAGLELSTPITAHTFRKSYGQNHVENGTPMHLLQKLMGHASITTTRDFYLRVGDTSEREATGRYGRLVSGPEAGSDRGDETDAKMTPDNVGR